MNVLGVLILLLNVIFVKKIIYGPSGITFVCTRKEFNILTIWEENFLINYLQNQNLMIFKSR